MFHFIKRLLLHVLGWTRRKMPQGHLDLSHSVDIIPVIKYPRPSPLLPPPPFLQTVSRSKTSQWEGLGMKLLWHYHLSLILSDWTPLYLSPRPFHCSPGHEPHYCQHSNHNPPSHPSHCRGNLKWACPFVGLELSCRRKKGKTLKTCFLFFDVYFNHQKIIIISDKSRFK